MTQQIKWLLREMVRWQRYLRHFGPCYWKLMGGFQRWPYLSCGFPSWSANDGLWVDIHTVRPPSRPACINTTYLKIDLNDTLLDGLVATNRT